MKNKKKYIKYILAFLIPIGLIIANLVILKLMNPTHKVFSPNQILVADLLSQYESLFAYFKDVLSGTASIFYSFSKSIGGSMISTFMYYLSSPLNLLMTFFPKSHVMYGMCTILFIKFGLCSLFMYLFLSKHFNTDKWHLLIFSTFYAIMGYNVVYYFNIMWFDVVYLTPLVILGLDNLVNKNKIGLYTITLTISIISNFYIAYMLCIFCVIYFIYSLIIKYKFNKKNKKVIIKTIKLFVFASLISALLSSILLVPGLIDMRKMLRIKTGNSQFKLNKPLYKLLLFIFKLFLGNQNADNILSKYTPNVYFGLFPLLLLILYFFNKKISKKERISTLIVLLIFIISFCFNLPNLVWHGFSYPNGYAYRFSFLFSFFALFIACESLLKVDYKISKKLLIGLTITMIIITILSMFNNPPNILKVIGIAVSFVLIGIYLIALIYKEKPYRKLITFSFIALLLIESLMHINTSTYLMSNLNYSRSYDKYYNQVCPITNKLKENNYRIDSVFMFGALSSFICGNSTISTALTTHNGNLYKFLYETGHTVTYSTILNELKGSPVIPTILGQKYFYGYSHELDTFGGEEYYKNISTFMHIDQYGDPLEYFVYKNDKALPIGYIINQKDIKITKQNAFVYQNEIFKTLTGLQEEIFKPYIPRTVRKGNYIVDIDNDNLIYISLKYPMPENEKTLAFIKIEDIIYKISTFDSGIFAIDNIYRNKGIEVIYKLKDDEYKTIKDNNDILSIYYLDNKVFEKGLNILKENTLDIKELKANTLSGDINIKKDNKTLLLTLPYEKGWHIYIDGKITTYNSIFDTFITIKLDKGKHNIKMIYYPEGLKIGIILTSIGVLSLVLYTLIARKGKKKDGKESINK